MTIRYDDRHGTLDVPEDRIFEVAEFDDDDTLTLRDDVELDGTKVTHGALHVDYCVNCRTHHARRVACEDIARMREVLR